MNFFKNLCGFQLALLLKKYSGETVLEDIGDHDKIMKEFMDQCCFETFEELFDLISQHKIKNIVTLKKSKTEQFQTISFV